MPPPVQVPVIDRGAPLVKVKIPESCQWLRSTAQRLVSAIQIVAAPKGN